MHHIRVHQNTETVIYANISLNFFLHNCGYCDIYFGFGLNNGIGH